MINSAYLKFLFWLVALSGPGFYAYGQALPNSFKVGECLEVWNSDSLKVFFLPNGTVQDKACAVFYRTGKISKTEVNFEGPVTDFYYGGRRAFEGAFRNNALNGKATYYFETGGIAETGNYQDHKRIGVWKYFYPNGNLEKVINFINHQPFVVTYLDSNQVVKVVNGNGVFTHKYVYDATGLHFTITGQLKDGQMQGEWEFVGGKGRELFENGKFIKGYPVSQKHNPTHYSTYNDSPRMRLSGYYPSENLQLGESKFCPFFLFGEGKPKRIVISEQKPYSYNKEELEDTFYPEIQKQFQAKLPKVVADQWLIIGVEIEKSGKVSTWNILSSINDEKVETIALTTLRSMNAWNPARINKAPRASSHYFSILIKQGQVQIPKLTYLNSRQLVEEIILKYNPE